MDPIQDDAQLRAFAELMAKLMAGLTYVMGPDDGAPLDPTRPPPGLHLADTMLRAHYLSALHLLQRFIESHDAALTDCKAFVALVLAWIEVEKQRPPWDAETLERYWRRGSRFVRREEVRPDLVRMYDEIAVGATLTRLEGALASHGLCLPTAYEDLMAPRRAQPSRWLSRNNAILRFQMRRDPELHADWTAYADARCLEPQPAAA